MTKTNPTSLRMTLLWLLLILSLLLNSMVLYAFYYARVQSLELLTQAELAVEQFSSRPVKTVVEIDQRIPLSETLPFSHSFSVPINTTYFLSTVVQTEVSLPLLGARTINIPIQADIPLQLELDIPVQTNIPLSFTYHLRTELPIEVVLPPETLAPISALLQQATAALK
ncbi:MAG: hypothetical protein U9Q70_08640 [Chloroflexota bacterium]|nr:hypothetical protein [Chloroflexota bacterium]